MSLQFIFGNPGSGKSHYLYQTVIRESMEHPEKNYLVLVPDQFTMQTQKDLVEMHPNHGIMNIDVLSFGRLAHRIFDEVGGNPRTVLDDEGKSLILRKIAGNYEKDLKVLGSNIKKLGYINEVKSIISEFTQYDIGPEELDRMLDEAKDDPSLFWKLQDIRKLYEGFQEYLSEKYITREELLDVLCSVLGESGILRGSVVALDGFTGFTPVQNKLLRELLGVCSKVMITVTMDEREDPYVLKHKYQLFAMSKQMVTQLMKIAREQQVEVEDPVCLYDRPVYRFRNQEALAFLERHLFRYGRVVYEKEQDAISISVSKNPKEEVNRAVGEIRKLVRTKGYRYREIAVITTDMERYADYIEKACGDYDIPVFLDHKRSVLLNAFVEYIRSLLAMADESFSYESVFRFLRTDLTGFTEEEIDRTENYVVALGIRGYKKWQEPWIRRAKGMKEEELHYVNSVRVRFVEKIDPLVQILKRRKKTVADITRALYEFLVKEELQQQLKGLEAQFADAGELVLEREYAQIYRIVIDLFDKFVELLGEEPVSLREYCDLLDAGLAEAKVGVIPPSMDQVVVGDLERTRLKDVKALFFLGVNDTLLPGQQGQSGLLSERDRERFAKAEIELTPGPKEKMYMQKFYLYLMLTKPTERLFLSYSKTTADGKSMRPAYLITDLLKLYERLEVEDDEALGLAGRELTPQTAILHLIAGLKERQAEPDDAWKELYSWYMAHPEWSGKIAELVEASFYRRPKDALSEAVAKKLYGELADTSVTRLERFSACAFAHFLTYGLRLQERQVYEFQALDMGNLFHGAMERFSGKMQEADRTFVTASEEEKEQWITESVQESIADYGNSVLYSSARNEYMITRLVRMMKRTVWALTKQLERGDFIPSGFEVTFANERRLGGKIDRIDLYEDDDHVYVKVIDYKTGAKAFDLGELYYGLQLQLVLYLNAAMEIEQKKHPDKTIVPAGIFYYQMRDPLVEPVEDEKERERQILKALRLDGVANADQEVLEHLEHGLAGASDILPVSRNKNGSLAKTSKALNAEQFQIVTDYAEHKKQEIRREILAGEVQARPYQLGERTGCDYCPYRKICKFDGKVPGNAYRKLGKYKWEELFVKMKEEV